MTKDDKKLLLGLLIAGTVVAGISVALNHSPRRQSFSKYLDGKPHNGGKVSAPVIVRLAGGASRIDPVSPGAVTAVDLEIIPAESCDDLLVRARGIEGVVIDEPNGRTSLGPCTPGVPHLFSVQLRVPGNSAGFLVVDAAMGTERASQAFGVRTAGARREVARLGQARQVPGKTQGVQESIVELTAD